MLGGRVDEIFHNARGVMVGLVEQQEVAPRFFTTLRLRIKEWLIHSVIVSFQTKHEAGNCPRRKEQGCITFKAWSFALT